MSQWAVFEGDALELLRTVPDASIDSIVTDPPYGLGSREPRVDELVAFLRSDTHLDTGGDFMGKQWQIPSVGVWRECLRVLKPGGHLLTFGGTRTFDLISLGLRAAGFEYRDTLQWLYGQGFPKSLDVSKAIDKEAGIERTTIRPYIAPDGKPRPSVVSDWAYSGERDGKHTRRPAIVTEPATEAARQWSGWGTALKPSWEPVLVFRKPLSGTLADNLLRHGVGAINVDGCRVGTDWQEPDRPASWAASGHSAKPEAEKIAAPPGVGMQLHPSGRWPTNAVFTHSAGCAPEGCAPDCPVRVLEQQSGVTKSGAMKCEVPGYEGASAVPFIRGRSGPSNQHGDTGTASRFFPRFEWSGEQDDPFCYTAKASTKEREAGCEAVPPADSGRRNDHATVKPVALMRWLVRLVTPPGGVCLDIFCGSGTTGVACVLEGFHFMGFEQDARFCEIAKGRIAYWARRAA